jgi:two-component system C4-dicarboxylate transport response regulator DctD
MAEGLMKGLTDNTRLTVRRGKILFVDEDARDLQLYASLLRQQGYSVDSCANYREGAEQIERGWYDLIILSQGGPVFRGQSLLERAIELNRRRPVLVLTRSIDMHSYLDAMHLGALDYQEKPPAPWEIVRTVSNCLSHRVAAG